MRGDWHFYFAVCVLCLSLAVCVLCLSFTVCFLCSLSLTSVCRLLVARLKHSSQLGPNVTRRMSDNDCGQNWLEWHCGVGRDLGN